MTCCVQRVLRGVALVGTVAALFFAGCGGGDEYSPGPARPGTPAAGALDLGYRDPTDTAVTSIRLSSSVEYVAADDRVNVFMRVRDQDGNALQHLNAHNFSVTLNPGTAPRSIDAARTELDLRSTPSRVVALVIDSSGSMQASIGAGRTRMQVGKDAAKLFVSLMAPGDLTAVVDFDDEARTVQQLTADGATLGAEIDKLTASGATNLGGALFEAVRAVGTRPGRRAVVFMTDGDDTVDGVVGGHEVWMADPTSTRYQGLKLAKENDLVVYTVGLGSDLSETGLGDLRTFAEETGGKFFQAVTAEGLLTAFGSTIPQEVDSLVPLETYVLSFLNAVRPPAGKRYEVALRTAVTYRNANGAQRAFFDGTYTVDR